MTMAGIAKPNLRGSAVGAAQQFLDEAMAEAKNTQRKYESYAKYRSWLAIVLKAIALLGGLAVATVNVNPVILGVTISVALIVDQLFSNYKRMMTEAAAANAGGRTIRKVEDNYNDQVLDVIRANEANQSKVAAELLVALARMSARTIRNEIDRVQTAVAEANLQFLSALNLDQPASTPLPHAASPAPARVPIEAPAVEPAPGAEPSAAKTEQDTTRQPGA